MIIGKDKERVRLIEVHLQLARELLETVRSDMKEIAIELNKNGIVTTRPPWYKLHQDIGKCSGLLDFLQEKKS